MAELKEFPEGWPPLDPKAAADELLRLFGAAAEAMAHTRIMGFMAAGDIGRVNEWFMVKAHIREMTHGVNNGLHPVH